MVLGVRVVATVLGLRLSDAEQAVLGWVGPRGLTRLTRLVPAGAGFRFYSVTGSRPR